MWLMTQAAPGKGRGDAILEAHNPSMRNQGTRLGTPLRWILALTAINAFSSVGVSGSYNGGGAGNNLPASTTSPIGPGEPSFDLSTPKNVTALVGKSAYLSCRVRNLGNKTVSWIRHRDIHILTVGSYTYTSDQRFQAVHHVTTDDWTLQIKWAQGRDAGVYECQISTQPVRSYFVNLQIVDQWPPPTEATPPPLYPFNLHWVEPSAKARSWLNRPMHDQPVASVRYPEESSFVRKSAAPTADILGGPDLHVDRGSTINLTCTIRYSPEPPAYIFWYHLNEVISYDSSRGGVSVITEKGEVTTSYLLIQSAELEDSGKYTCAPSNADVATVRVHVLNGERPAAMQTGSAGLSNSSMNIVALMLFCWLYSALMEHTLLERQRR